MDDKDLDALAIKLAARMHGIYVTHQEQQVKFEQVFAIDCTNPAERDRMRGNIKFLDAIHSGSQRAGERLIIFVISAVGIGALSVLFGQDWINKLRGP